MKISRSKLIYLALGLTLVGLLVYAFWPTPIEVDTGTVSRGLLEVTVNEDGKTRVRERYVVSAPLGGRLMRIGLNPGDAVEAGRTVLAVIEPSDPALLDERARAEARARLKAAQSSQEVARQKLAQATVSLELARKEHARAEQLHARKGISEADYEQAEHQARLRAEEMKAAEFGVDIARFEVEIARAALLRSGPTSPGELEQFRMELKAPTGGKVLRVLQESATVVTPGMNLLEVGDLADLEAEIDVLSSDGVKIQSGAKVYFEHWGGEAPLFGRVRHVEPAAFLKVSALGIEEQRVNVIVDFVDPLEKRAGLGDAFRVEARIVIWQDPDTLKVPAGALFRRQGGWAVFKILHGRASLSPVEIGPSDGLETQIRSGLKEGETVLLHPTDEIADGARVVAR